MQHFNFYTLAGVHRYYRAERWFDARAVALQHFGSDDIRWRAMTAEEFDAKVKSAPFVFELTWSGNDAGRVPTRAMTVTPISKSARNLNGASKR